MNTSEESACSQRAGSMSPLMTGTFDAEFSIPLAESAEFSLLSGDFNPLHVDAAAARRTQFGGTVIHGIHLFLRTLDQLAARDFLAGREPLALSATFNNPVPSGAKVTVHFAAQSNRIRVTSESANGAAFTGTIELSPAVHPASDIRDAEFAPACPRQLEFPPAITGGDVPLKLSSARLGALFPSLSANSFRGWIADLLATTQIVGMRCPGMDSIYSGLRLRRGARPEPAPQSLSFQVNGFDKRSGIVRIQVSGACFAGSIEAFFRPRPVVQRSAKEISAVVSDGAFGGHRVLVVGGSRGLGELTAKIAAAGGADVTISYSLGRQDAERICTEIKANGGKCSAHHLDVASGLQPPPEWLADGHFSHVYFFASPRIAKNPGQWNETLFRQFSDVYVSAFGTLVGHLLATGKARDRSLRFLYPSSIFVTEPAAGFSEYAVAKAAGEALCDQLLLRHDVRFAKPRLPRMRTDQTSSLMDVGAADPFPVMLAAVRDLHSL